MITLKQKSLLALIISGALFSSANSFCWDFSSFNCPAAGYYTRAAVAGALPAALVVSKALPIIEGELQLISKLPIYSTFIPPIATQILTLDFNPTTREERNARVIRGTSCALTMGAILKYVPGTPQVRAAKLGAMLCYGTFASVIPTL